MGRRRTSTAEALMDAVALLPEWGGLLLAVVSYVLFDQLSRLTPVSPTPGQAGSLLLVAVLAAVGVAGKIVVPALCVIAAIVSFARRRKRKQLVSGAMAGGTAAVSQMTWREFEAFVAEVFRRRGYTVDEHFTGGADGGYDLQMRKSNELALVQCKQWKAFKVGVTVVRELYGVMAARGASEGYVVTSGVFTSEAMAFAQGRNIELWDGSKLLQLLATRTVAAPSMAASTSPSPACPRCGAGMVKRTAKKGANPGSAFWGCSQYPACRGTREA
ncbi:MAG: restriction endonuclease [Burkholderiales bacterium]|nr:restriction endonuclease [Burkholderiales bacterium]